MGYLLCAWIANGQWHGWLNRNQRYSLLLPLIACLLVCICEALQACLRPSLFHWTIDATYLYSSNTVRSGLSTHTACLLFSAAYYYMMTILWWKSCEKGIDFSARGSGSVAMLTCACIHGICQTSELDGALSLEPTREQKITSLRWK